MNFLFILLFILFIISLLFIFFLIKVFNQRLKELPQPKETDQTLIMLHQRLDQVSSTVQNQLNTVINQVNERLKETSEALATANKTIGDRLDSATNVIGKVHHSLGRLEEGLKEVLTVGRDISSLQDLLRAPKFRGGVGEFLLESLLAQILPGEHFETQYMFKSGEKVDAVIKIGQHLVSVDSKFPLENFKRVLEAKAEEEKKSLKKKFIQDVKKHIDSIAQKYILPDEGTFEFAIMYIPAENVYYETIVKDEQAQEDLGIYSYALAKKVIPVSPNSFYAYLQVIILGLKGLKIEKSAKQIISGLSSLQGELDKFKEDFEIIGKHLSNTKSKYDEAEKRLDKFTDKLLSATASPPIEYKENERPKSE
ncbi:MAG: DNA recombination protein RmuC [Candidatus Omnitrophica bacterium]|nr:DNA recombination protein RmuC [Candidatus Omnitrophota bacterium]